MPGSYIVAGARTPIGKMSGALASFSAADLGGVAIASTAAAQITTMAPFEKLPPYGNNTLPAGVKPHRSNPAAADDLLCRGCW